MENINMDLSLRRIVITEDEDLNLDKLLLGDNSGAGAAADAAQSSPSSPPPSPPSDGATAAAQCPASPILAREDDGEDDGCGHWVLPAPARPGDYINNTLHKVPSKSILKKTSSYGNFDSSASSSTRGGNGSSSGLARKASSLLSFRNLDSSSSSQGSAGGRRDRVANSGGPLDRSLSDGVSKMTKKTSFLSMESINSNEGAFGRGGQQQVAIGWDLDSSSPPCSPSLPSPGNKNFLMSAPLPAMPSLAADAAAVDNKNISDADKAAGMDSSGTSKQSGLSSARMRRNVSFNSVDVREYDRTVGDNPSCRSGPPLSLDWSYSKKYSKDLEEYELERSSERVSNLRKLHVNKYKRRNMLAFHWGHSQDELKEARRGTRKMQRQRSMTQVLLPVHMAEEAFVSFKNFIKKKRDGNEDLLSDMSNSGSTKDSSHRHSLQYNGLCGQQVPQSPTSTQRLSSSVHSA